MDLLQRGGEHPFGSAKNRQSNEAELSLEEHIDDRGQLIEGKKGKLFEREIQKITTPGR